MLPLSSILAATPPRTKQRARVQCFGKALVPKKRQSTATGTGGYLVEDQTGKYREFKYQIKCTDGWRKVATRFYGPVKASTKVWCWCSCPYFKYHCEVALAARGSSAVVQSNGQRPRFTNPKMEPRVCKHVYLLFALAVRSDIKQQHAEKQKEQDVKAKKKRAEMKKAAEKKKAELQKKAKERKEKEKAVRAAREEAQAATAKARQEKQAAAKEAREAKVAAAKPQSRATPKPLAKPATPPTWGGDKKR